MRRSALGLLFVSALLGACSSNDTDEGPTLVLEVGGDFEYAGYSDADGHHEFEPGQTRAVISGDDVPNTILLQVTPYPGERKAGVWCRATLDGVVEYEDRGTDDGALCSDLVPGGGMNPPPSE
ncbi:hypothetical protein L5G28_16340 [Gordonia sp. HY285]|uniref:hypothetical protein n=1 Tax=Gordonia liuliyuniae TaxID=2911517 RepID=UPI001F3C1FD4|nr:hypothetical protein [Gordonia liuliyuniae]MCF8611716.1 hypothetical protein [Gordonia liuliyuniae]